MDDIGLGEDACPKCLNHTYRRDCLSCDEFGMSYHDCGEDCCCCLDPEPNVRCDECRGRTWHNWCPRCGWDLLEKRYINGCDERYRSGSTGPGTGRTADTASSKSDQTPTQLSKGYGGEK